MKELALTIPGPSGPIPINPTGLPPTTPFGQNIISFALNFITVAAIFLALAFIIYNSIMIIVSEGDKQKIQVAKNGIAFSIIGLVIILMAAFIVRVIGNFFGVPLLGP